MTEAFKCDVCGEMKEGKPATTLNPGLEEPNYEKGFSIGNYISGYITIKITAIKDSIRKDICHSCIKPEIEKLMKKFNLL